MKKSVLATVMGVVCTVASLAFIGFFLIGLWGGNLGQTQKTGSEGIGHALTVVLTVPFLLADGALLLVAAVLAAFAAKRSFAIGKGESEKIAVIIVSVVFKCLCVAGTAFCCALLFALDNGGGYGAAGVGLCVLLMGSAAADIVVARLARQLR